MSKFLSIQHTSHGIEMALFDCTTLLCSAQDDKKKASKNIIALMGDLLRAQNLTLQDLDFIAVNQGPGPFTTLRVVIASVNGLSFATKKPIIGIDGLDALITEHRNTDYQTTVALLNAFSNDVYYARATATSVETGCKNISVYLEELRTSLQQPAYFIGNGVELFATELQTTLGDLAIIPPAHELPAQCSLQTIANLAYKKWVSQEGLTHQIMPLYLKSQLFQTK